MQVRKEVVLTSRVVTPERLSKEPVQQVVDGMSPEIWHCVKENFALMVPEITRSFPFEFPEKMQEETGKPWLTP
jgi:hypothetical protein